MKSETKIYRKIFIFLFALLFAQPFCTAQFYGDPPDNTHPWAIHDNNRPQPPRVEPAKNPGGAPSDAIVLFDGSLESFTKNWSHTNAKRKKDWKVENGSLISVGGAGTIASKAEFSDCQLHIEWSAPSKIVGSGQGRASTVGKGFLMNPNMAWNQSSLSSASNKAMETAVVNVIKAIDRRGW